MIILTDKGQIKNIAAERAAVWSEAVTEIGKVQIMLNEMTERPMLG